MEQTNGFRQPGDIGGPMCISNGYRWNVPLVTYGFDPSFIKYYGTNGVAAVESAIQIINELPSASDIILTNYSFDTTRFNGDAMGEFLLDLKSTTLALLLEQLGLAQPTRYTFVLRQWNPVFIAPPYGYSWESDWPAWVFPDYISERNFDPETLAASQDVNREPYVGAIFSDGRENEMIPFCLNTTVPEYIAVADRSLNLGAYYAGLTYDDVGGLRYLLSTNNIRYETLLPGVRGIGRSQIVNGAWRPGVNKITFFPQPVDRMSGAFLPMKSRFTDVYISNGIPVEQRVERIISRPDFLFSADTVDFGETSVLTPSSPAEAPALIRTGTTNWINNAAFNGNPGGGGPGTIQPPVRITFNKLGTVFWNFTDESAGTFGSPEWGTYDGTTNLPIIYPIYQQGKMSFDVRMLLQMNIGGNFSQTEFNWPLTNVAGSVSLFQTSSDLTDWVTLFSATNNGSVWTFINTFPSSNQRFYRVIAH